MKPYVSFMAALILCPMLTARAGIGEPTVIELRDHASVSGGHIRLADIADIRGGDEIVRRRLATLKIAPAPGLGTSKTLRREDVRLVVRRTLGANPPVIEGAQATKIERPVVEYEGAQFVEAARTYVLAQLGRERPDLSRIEVTPVGDFPAVRGPAGSLRISVRQLRTDLAIRRVSVWVDVEIDGSVYRSVPMWLAVNAYRPVVVARRAHRSKEPLTRQDFTIEEREVAALREMPLAVDAALAGKRARHALAAGSIIRPSDIEVQPSVLADQEIDVRVLAGPIAIETRAIAEQEGDAGEYIRVRNPASALTYRAEVVDRGKVLVTDR